MSVEISSDPAAARALADKKRALEQEQANLELEKARAERARARAIDEQREKTERDIVEISKAGNAQLENTKKLSSERVRMLNESNQKQFEQLAASTAERIRALDAQSLQAINDHRQGTMEKLAFVSRQAEDPFYHVKSLNPALTEGPAGYEVRVALPEHEAKNLFVSTEGQSVKLALARRFQDDAKAPEGERVTRTNSYQSIVEQLSLPGAIEPKGVSRSYADGVLTIRLPKAGAPKPPAANPAVAGYVPPAADKKPTPPA